LPRCLYWTLSGLGALPLPSATTKCAATLTMTEVNRFSSVSALDPRPLPRYLSRMYGSGVRRLRVGTVDVLIKLLAHRFEGRLESFDGVGGTGSWLSFAVCRVAATTPLTATVRAQTTPSHRASRWERQAGRPPFRVLTTPSRWRKP
jgi:hypothetical protein